MKKIEIYVDGACSGNPGPGGWGALLRYKNIEKELSGFEAHTTNNRMELMAAIKALESLKEPVEIDIYTDSTYVRSGITQWLAGWIAKGWKTSQKEDVKNRDLWEELYRLTQQHTIEWHWVKGHAGHIENERVDQLAREAIKKGLCAA